MQPLVERTAGELLDPLLSAGKMEVMSDLARPLAASVVAELVRVPLEGRGRKELSISRLRSVESGGQRLTGDEVAASSHFFMTTARRTLSDMLGNTLLLLSLYPDVLKRLHHQPAPLYSTVEEAMRYVPPVWAAQRTAIAPVALGGQNLPQGAHVRAWVVSANHDPEQFVQPERFDIERVPNRRLSFWDGGPFSCLGVGPVRLAARVTLAAIVKRVSRFELAPGDAVEVATPREPEPAEPQEALTQPEMEQQMQPCTTLPDRCSLTRLAVVFEARD